MYPTRAVRHAAWDALDYLFPVSIVSFPCQLADIILMNYRAALNPAYTFWSFQ